MTNDQLYQSTWNYTSYHIIKHYNQFNNKKLFSDEAIETRTNFSAPMKQYNHFQLSYNLCYISSLILLSYVQVLQNIHIVFETTGVYIPYIFIGIFLNISSFFPIAQNKSLLIFFKEIYKLFFNVFRMVPLVKKCWWQLS